MKASELATYAVPDQKKLDTFPFWAIVRYDPKTCRDADKLVEGRYWIPLVASGVRWSHIYWMDVIEVKLAEKTFTDLCRPCTKKFKCAESGRGIDPKHECSANRASLVPIRKRPSGVERTKREFISVADEDRRAAKQPADVAGDGGKPIVEEVF